MSVSAQSADSSLSEDGNNVDQLKAEQTSKRSALDFVKQQPLGTMGLLIIVSIIFES